jgi:CheY-like chemotaxis protein
MGGEIDVESRVGVGSTFRVRLPLVQAPESVVPDLNEEPRRILVVDDDGVGQYIYRHFLRGRNYDVVCAASGREAIAAASAQRFDLILMDLHLPDIDGLETSGRIRELGGYDSTPILALTASTTDEVRVACRRAGLQAFLTKPVRAAELRSTVERWLAEPALAV